MNLASDTLPRMADWQGVPLVSDAMRDASVLFEFCSTGESLRA